MNAVSDHFDALTFPARQRVCSSIQGQILQTDVDDVLKLIFQFSRC